MNEDITKQVGRILIFGVILILFAPFLMTRTLGLISFENTGQIGDTIGGITAPIASLIGSWLVFYALKAQIEANKLIQDQFTHQKTEEEFRKTSLYLSEQLLLLREDINSFNFTIDSTSYNGTEAIGIFFEKINSLSHDCLREYAIKEFPEYNQVVTFLKRLNYLMQRLERSNLDKSDKEYLFETIDYTYEIKLKSTLCFFEKYRGRSCGNCPKCGKGHLGIPEEIYEFDDSINNKIKQIKDL